MKVRALASGSSGNSYLVQAGGYSLLVDCGLTMTNAQKFLRDEGVDIAGVGGIFLTHDHHDHLRGAGSVSRKWGIPVYANSLTLQAAHARWSKMEQLEVQRYGRASSGSGRYYNFREMPKGGVENIGPIEISSFPVSHDGVDSVCYTFRADGVQAVILTDLGCPTPEIFEPLTNSHLIVLEANHDLDMLEMSRYPYPLKARIKGNRGHLSNLQSARILQRCLEQSGTDHVVWLGHLSQENNTPAQAVGTIRAVLEEAGILGFPLQVATRDKPSLRYDSENPEPAPEIEYAPLPEKTKVREKPAPLYYQSSMF